MTNHPAVPPCIFFAATEWEHNETPPEDSRAPLFESLIARARRTQCDALLTAPPSSGLAPYFDLIDDPDRAARTGTSGSDNSDDDDTASVLQRWSALADENQIQLLIDVDIVSIAALGTYARRWMQAYRLAGPPQVVDPRLSHHDAARARLGLVDGRCDPALIDDWAERLVRWLDAGVRGFRLRRLLELPAADVVQLVALVRKKHPKVLFLGETPGLNPGQLQALAPAGLNVVFSSLPWWDGRAPWLVQEHTRLRRVAPTIAATACVAPTDSLTLAKQKLWTAALSGDVFMVVSHPGQPEGLDGVVTEVTAWRKRAGPASGELRQLFGPSMSLTALLRGDGMPFTTQASTAGPARLLLSNLDATREVTIDWDLIRSRLPDGYADITLTMGRSARTGSLPDSLAPSECVMLWAKRGVPVTGSTSVAASARNAALQALNAPRIAIEAVTPTIDAGRFPLKRVLGESISVQADVFMDGHDHIAVHVAWRAVDEIGWHEVAMEEAGNDRYIAQFSPQRIGRHEYKIQAWRDAWGTYCDELGKKFAAGLDVSLELEEGRLLIADTIAQVPDGHPGTAALAGLLKSVGAPTTAPKRRASRGAVGNKIAPMQPDHVALLLSQAAAQAMASAAIRPFLSESERSYPITVERQAARFASWYELFPRSQSGSTERHGNFDDVIARLPAIRDMGFDVLYFPPIHPIGLSNRKGKNNTLNAGADQPGSPYAIGSDTGGHSAIHPQLGTLDDFKRLVAAAHAHGLEIALDFAIQCSPDHPWLKENPEWFAWRADGSMRYAENPPKKYEDIVNVDFYSSGATSTRQAALWRALRDVILYWVEQGVRTFRVDNPHTKPLPFWEWMIGEVQAKHPDTLFLSEAFTRPKMMYRLAKAGFSQSYTYFTWRENKQELSQYLVELNTPVAADIFRPHFFVNTPDINPRFLQQSGRPGHLIRMALAATTSGLWGMYSGFELCEARPMPGKEEYLDSEKYEVRAWDWNRPGNIIAEMTALNLIRRHNPALQTHLGLTLQTVYHDEILLFTKATPEKDNVLLVAVSLNPHAPLDATFELPLWSFGLPDDGALAVSDLVHGNNMIWHGKFQTVHLAPEMPYAIWRLDGPGE